MEEVLFYRYLSYQKTRKGPLKNRILNLPRIPLCFFCLSLVFIIIALAALIYNEQAATIMAVVLELIFCFALEYSIEKYKIHYSEKGIKEFCSYCFDLKAWAISNSFNCTKNIAEIKDRIEKRVAVYKKEQEMFTAQIDKWLQMIIVPIVILAITYIINQSIPRVEKISSCINILMFLGLIFGFVSMMKNASGFVQRHKAEQMEYFAKDLQAILDLDTYNIGDKVGDSI